MKNLLKKRFWKKNSNLEKKNITNVESEYCKSYMFDIDIFEKLLEEATKDRNIECLVVTIYQNDWVNFVMKVSK